MSQKKARAARKEQAAQQKEQNKRKHRTRQDIILNIIIAAVILAVAGAGVYAVGSQIAKNRQEAAQVQQGTDGEENQTIKTVAESLGMSVADYLNEYGLEADTPETMPLGEAYNKMTVENVAKASGQSVEEFRQSTYLPDEVPDTMVWSEAQKEMPVRGMMSEEEFNQNKQEYGLGDEVTLDMKWKDFLPIIQEKQAQVSGQSGDGQSGQTDSAPQQ